MTGERSNHGGATAIDWSGYEAVVGPRWSYYGPRFEHFAQGKLLSWNWPAFFATLAWLRYRRLHAWSWLYVLASAPVLVFLSMFVATVGPDDCETALDPGVHLPFLLVGLAWAGFIWVVVPLLASYLYYRHVRVAVYNAGDARAAPRQGMARGAVALVLAAQACVLVAAAIASSQYSSYAYRSRVSEAFSLADGLKTEVAEYFLTHGRFPAQATEVSGQTSGEYVRRIAVESDGTIRATYNSKALKLAGHSVVMVPTVKDGEVRWACGSPDLPDVCLPLSCRGKGK